MVIFCLLIEAMWKIGGFDIHFTFIHVIAIMMGKDTGKEDIQKIMNGDIAGEMAYLGIALFAIRRQGSVHRISVSCSSSKVSPE